MKPTTLKAVAEWLEGRYTEVTPELLRTIADGLEDNTEPPTCPGCGGPVATHYAVIYFDGDFDGEHPDPELKGSDPSMTLVAAGDEEFCWDALRTWTLDQPLRENESAEVLARTLL